MLAQVNPSQMCELQNTDIGLVKHVHVFESKTSVWADNGQLMYQ